MKIRSLMLFLLCAVALVMTTGCGDNLLESTADKDSDEACEYQVSRDLNEGEWNDVINADSDCASSMQKAAAYFGRAGYDIADIIARMSEANEEEDDNDAETYLDTLVGTVSKSKLDDLNSAVVQYSDVDEGDDDYDDAQFYIKMFIRPVLSFSSLKGVFDSTGTGIEYGCDVNNNGTPDDVDAASCAIIYSVIPNCEDSITGAAVTPTAGLTFTGYENTYTGLQVVISGSGPSEGCHESNTYYRLLDDSQASVTTTSDDCTVNSVPWNCPYEDADGENIDVVAAFENGLSSAEEALEELIGDEGESELDESITGLREEACGGDGCTSQEISDYIQNLESE